VQNGRAFKTRRIRFYTAFAGFAETECRSANADAPSRIDNK